MSVNPSEPPVADAAPWSDALTDYDLAHLVLYLRILDADRDGADWREVTRCVLGRDPEAPGAHGCWTSHKARAEWMTTTGYRLLAALDQSS